jgi:transaldolase/glucose-6-phosphate isomerase
VDVNPVQQLHELGQSVWLDYIRKDLLESGELAQLISDGEVRGVTSNPTIFQQAIGNSSLYDEAARSMAQAGWSDEQVFESLAVDDIRAATDLFLPVYEDSEGADGFVSIEVSPRLAYDTSATLGEARRLWSEVNRPNVMIKIPATEPGLPAIEQAISEGINVNVTLVFSLKRYAQVMQAYLQGLERRLQAGHSLDHVASVASFFVSRVDTLVDGLLEALLREEGPKAPRAVALLGKAAIANAKLAYAQFKAFFDDDRFTLLLEQGARLQRPLWASTSTKNPAYRDVLYVENLIGPHTVNTLPPATLASFREHGQAALSIEEGLSAARAQLEALAELGISMDQVTEQLEREGVQKFAESFEGLLETLRARTQGFRQELGPLQPAYRAALQQLEERRAGPRLWERDHSLWPQSKNRLPSALDWLDAPRATAEVVSSVRQAASSAGKATVGWIAPGADTGWRSLLEPFIRPGQGLEVVELEGLEPTAQRSFARRTPAETTLFLVAQTDRPAIEAQACAEPHWRRAQERLGEAAGRSFAVLAEPASPLSLLAADRGWSLVRRGTPIAHGPFGILAAENLTPAELAGVDVGRLLAGANQAARASGPNVAPARSPGLSLAAFLVAAADGRRTVEVLADTPLGELAQWIKTLSGLTLGLKLRVQKGPPRSRRSARPRLYLRLSGGWDDSVRSRVARGAPVLVLQVGQGLAGLGSVLMRWQLGVAWAAHLLRLNPFARFERTWDLDHLGRSLARYTRRADAPIPRSRALAGGLMVWPARRWIGLAETAGLEQLAAAALEWADQQGGVRLSLYPVRESRELGRIETILNRNSGANPPRSALHPATLQLVLKPRQDPQIPGFDVSYAALNQLLAAAEFEALQASDLPAMGILIPPEVGLRRLAAALAAAASRRE